MTYDMNDIVNFMTESDGEIDLGEDFDDTDDSDWEYDEEEKRKVVPEPNHPATAPAAPLLNTGKESATDQSVQDSHDEDNLPLNLLRPDNHNADIGTVETEENTSQGEATENEGDQNNNNDNNNADRWLGRGRGRVRG